MRGEALRIFLSLRLRALWNMRPNQGEQDEEREPEESERIQQIGDANPGLKDDDAAEASTPPASSGDE